MLVQMNESKKIFDKSNLHIIFIYERTYWRWIRKKLLALIIFSRLEMWSGKPDPDKNRSPIRFSNHPKNGIVYGTEVDVFPDLEGIR